MAFSIDVPMEVRSALVPSLILQPLIENALKHGVGATSGLVEITLKASREADQLHITVENDMPSIETRGSRPPGMGAGLRNVAERLSTRFQEECNFVSGVISESRYRASFDIPWRSA